MSAAHATAPTPARATGGPRKVEDTFGWVKLLVSLAFVLVVPLFLISLSLRLLIADRDFILEGFRENQVHLTTRLDQPRLERIADEFSSYLLGPGGRLDIRVTRDGQQVPLLNEREIVHMEDVQALIRLFMSFLVFGLVVSVVRVGFALGVERTPVPLGRDLLLGAGLMVGVVLFIGILSLIDFSQLWLRFHHVAFRNDLWMLDPRTDYLIMLFPQPFWFASTMRMALYTTVGTVAVAVAGFLLWRLPRGG